MRAILTSTLFLITSATLFSQVYLGEDYVPSVTERQTISETDSILSTVPMAEEYMSPATKVNKMLLPRVFQGYRHIEPTNFNRDVTDPIYFLSLYKELGREEVDTVMTETPEIEEPAAEPQASEGLDLSGFDPTDAAVMVTETVPTREELPVAFGSATPNWLRRAIDSNRFQEDHVYSWMVKEPSLIQFAFWNLPVPPTMPEEDYSFRGFLKRLDIPQANPEDMLNVNATGGRINWLHTVNAALQLSQAYVSGNWYQGGSDYLAFLGSFTWDVMLNNYYYPNMIFQSTFSYKFSINSTPDDEYHKYSIAQDQLQYNLKFGYKAVHNWYYSMNMQFKTQLFNSYPSNSNVRKASFLSPGDLNLGLGMTYNKENKKKTLRFSASISPVSYNLKTCIDRHIDETQFGIKPGRKLKNEIGSNAELNFYAKFWGKATYTTRLFLFTDYKLFQSDWENTLNFQFSRFFSTQIYAHLRYDTSTNSSISRSWKKFMLKEILSFGLAYTFSTK